MKSFPNILASLRQLIQRLLSFYKKKSNVKLSTVPHSWILFVWEFQQVTLSGENNDLKPMRFTASVRVSSDERSRVIRSRNLLEKEHPFNKMSVVTMKRRHMQRPNTWNFHQIQWHLFIIFHLWHFRSRRNLHDANKGKIMQYSGHQ